MGFISFVGRVLFASIFLLSAYQEGGSKLARQEGIPQGRCRTSLFVMCGYCSWMNGCSAGFRTRRTTRRRSRWSKTWLWRHGLDARQPRPLRDYIPLLPLEEGNSIR
ncbi:uncharacterized protein LOC119346512 [Triticum dicoccoides]|uniref:uncharacterized protein LOC119346512 n=1 Tax=Triticum dicoccoides TaxID=85692 RepID=UPI00188E42D5|nr:uncharacterized protein LOC119346512 [Triticum dicoccoides]